MSGKLSNEFTQAAQKAGSLQGLLDEFFYFLHSRTDFYVQFPKPEPGSTTKYSMGFPEGEAEKMLLQSMKKFPFKDYDRTIAEMGQAPVAPAPSPAVSAPTPSIASSAPKTSTPAAKAPISEKSSSSSSSSASPIRYTDKGKQIPLGNGGIEPKHGYSWTQSLQEVTVHVPLFDLPGLKGKEVEVVHKPNSIQVKARGQLLLEGTLAYTTKEKEIWWDQVCTGHAEIDTSRVDSTKSITEYDEATQGQIRRLVHEEREKRLANPAEFQRPSYYDE